MMSEQPRRITLFDRVRPQFQQKQPRRQYTPSSFTPTPPPRIEPTRQTTQQYTSSFPRPSPQIEPTQTRIPSPTNDQSFPYPPYAELQPNYKTEFGLGVIKGQATEPRANGDIVRFINWAGRRESNSEFLWEDFHDCFEDWTEDIFNIADKQALRDLRSFLRENGVFIKTTRGVAIAATLMEALKEEKFHIWTSEEIQEQLRYRAKKEKVIQRREAYITSTKEEKLPEDK